VFLEVLEEIAGHLSRLHRNQEMIMATLAQLNAAVTAVSDAISKIGTDVTAAIADIAALQAAGGIQPTDLDPVVAALTTAASSLGAASASLEAVLPPPAPPPPGPTA
jgi:hypothetical protein